jgi:hypothetical protein
LFRGQPHGLSRLRRASWLRSAGRSTRCSWY